MVIWCSPEDQCQISLRLAEDGPRLVAAWRKSEPMPCTLADEWSRRSLAALSDSDLRDTGHIAYEKPCVRYQAMGQVQVLQAAVEDVGKAQL